LSVAHPRTPLETVIDALAARGKKPRGNDRGWTALCPAHEDNTPSLSIGVGADDRVLIHCHAGCQQTDILNALDLTLADLFAGPRTNGTTKVEDARYRYEDETGVHLFDVVRYWTDNGKTFLQQAPDGTWTTRGITKVPYRLPQLIEAIADGQTVFVVEGEKDVHALERAGYTATTNPGGAGKWRTDYNHWFTGADVIVVADRDTPGRNHAQQILEQLRPIAASVQVVEPAQGKDTYDHLAAGLTIEDLVLVDPDQPAAPDHILFVNWHDFWADETDTAEWLLEDVIALGRGHAIYATHKQGKSLFLLWVAATLATTHTHIDVIYLDYEMSPADIRERLEDMGHGPASDLARLHYAFAPAIHPLDTPQGATQLADIIDTHTDPARHLVVFIDTFGRAVEGEENSNDTTRSFYRWTGTMLRNRHATWARLDHAGKDNTKGQRGGSAKGDDVDIIWKLARQDNGIRLHRDNARMSWVPETVTYTIAADPLTYTRTQQTVPAGTADCIGHLDRLNLPLGISVRKARTVLKEAGHPTRTDVVTAALRTRRERLETGLKVFPDPPGNTPPT